MKIIDKEELLQIDVHNLKRAIAEMRRSQSTLMVRAAFLSSMCGVIAAFWCFLIYKLTGAI